MKICFIGHQNHKSTLSNLFFLDILEKDAIVDRHYFDETNYWEVNKLYNSDYDLVVCYQYDFMAFSFIARGYPTVVVPMYDGSEHHSSSHWDLLGGSRIVNFSYNLHIRAKRSGVDDIYVKYFPNPALYHQVDYSQRKAFFWQRRPNHLDWRTVKNIILGDQLDAFHLHAPSDDRLLSGIVPSSREQKRFNITVSTWFEDQKEMNSLIDQYNIYIAPRATEGIGMAFLEAMARGMLVIVNDKPTHNEYVSNWVNGVLYDMSNPCFVNLGRMQELGQRARETCFLGYEKWINSIDTLRDFIYSTPKPRAISNKVMLSLYDSLPRCFFERGLYNQRVQLIQKIKKVL